MERIVVVGPPCSGKTTTARTLSRRLGIPHVELDALWWEPNWTEAGAERFTERLKTAIDQPRWVLDGNYLTVGARDVVYPAPDTVVWLDHGRWVTVPRGMRRMYRRVLLRTELWSGNREPLRYLPQSFTLLKTAVQKHPIYNREVETLLRDASLAHLQWVRLKNPVELRRWIASLWTV